MDCGSGASEWTDVMGSVWMARGGWGSVETSSHQTDTGHLTSCKRKIKTTDHFNKSVTVLINCLHQNFKLQQAECVDKQLNKA